MSMTQKKQMEQKAEKVEGSHSVYCLTKCHQSRLTSLHLRRLTRNTQTQYVAAFIKPLGTSYFAI